MSFIKFIYFEPIPLSSNMHIVQILELPYFSIKRVHVTGVQ